MVTSPLITIAGEGRIPEQQHGQEHVLPVSGAGEGHHPSGHARDGAVVTNPLLTIAGE